MFNNSKGLVYWYNDFSKKYLKIYQAGEYWISTLQSIIFLDVCTIFLFWKWYVVIPSPFRGAPSRWVPRQLPHRSEQLPTDHWARLWCLGMMLVETRPSILCVTHQMSRKKRNHSVDWTLPYAMMNYKCYLMVLGQYMMIVAGTWSVFVGTAWYWVEQGQQRACIPVYVWKSGDWSGDTDP